MNCLLWRLQLLTASQYTYPVKCSLRRLQLLPASQSFPCEVLPTKSPTAYCKPVLPQWGVSYVGSSCKPVLPLWDASYKVSSCLLQAGPSPVRCFLRRLQLQASPSPLRCFLQSLKLLTASQSFPYEVLPTKSQTAYSKPVLPLWGASFKGSNWLLQASPSPVRCFLQRLHLLSVSQSFPSEVLPTKAPIAYWKPVLPQWGASYKGSNCLLKTSPSPVRCFLQRLQLLTAS